MENVQREVTTLQTVGSKMQNVLCVGEFRICQDNAQKIMEETRATTIGNSNTGKITTGATRLTTLIIRNPITTISKTQTTISKTQTTISKSQTTIKKT